MKKIEADRTALDYKPKKFPFTMSETTSDFIERNPLHGTRGQFRMSEIVAEQTGVADLERSSSEDLIEAKALEKLKELEEKAYQEAYTLGLDEGRSEAFKKHEEELNERLAQLDGVIGSLNQLKLDLVSFNESHLVKLAYYLATRIATYEIEQNPQAILSALKEVVVGSHDQEQLTIRLSTQDFQFLNESRERLGKEFDFLKKARLDESPDIKPGGCIIETNYGVVDATLEERVAKLQDNLFAAAPKVRNIIAS